MTKLLFCSILIGLSYISTGQNVNIPDANFKSYLIGNTAINTNADMEIQVSEAAAFNGTIDCSNLNISDLTGIASFTSLYWLKCSHNQLTSLDVSKNVNLAILHCLDNQITELNLSNNPALGDLDCAANQLECLNVQNGNNTSFSVFSAHSNSNLTCIQVDDELWAANNWTFIDAQTSFSSNCGDQCSVHLSIDEWTSTEKKPMKMLDLLGRETEYKPNSVIIYIYDNGTARKVYSTE